jgi:hypothetical protein
MEIIKDDYEKITAEPLNMVNKGIGAGGANTNKNGLTYEEITNLNDLYSMSLECDLKKKHKYKKIKFIGYDDIEFINANKSILHKFMKDNNQQNEILQPAAGCKYPDEAYINVNSKTLFIIEKKFQNQNGSVDEKIQTGPFKKLHYGRLFPNYKIHYLYCLSDWFKAKEYESVLEYLRDSEIPVFWGSDNEYKKKIVNFMCSHN